MRSRSSSRLVSTSGTYSVSFMSHLHTPVWSVAILHIGVSSRDGTPADHHIVRASRPARHQLVDGVRGRVSDQARHALLLAPIGPPPVRRAQAANLARTRQHR